MVLFEEQGYFATTIEQITKHAGVSKGLVYNYFTSKEALLIGLLEHATTKMVGQADGLTGSESLEDSFSTFLDGYFSFLQNEKRFLKLQLTLMVTPELKSIVGDSVKRRADMLLTRVIQVLEQNEIAQAKEKAQLIIALLDGVALHFLSIYDNYPLKSMKQPLKTAIMQLIA